MRNIHIKIEYDGSAFHGWQFQPNVRTVQAVLEEALSIVCGERIHVHGTSRTDAGVHAYGQHATFDTGSLIPVQRLPLATNNLLRDVKLIRAREEAEGFHARYDAVGKTYIYRIALPPAQAHTMRATSPSDAQVHDIFLRNHLFFMDEELDIANMREACKFFIGTHDFASFRATGSKITDNTIRTIKELEISEQMQTDTKGNEYKELVVRVTGDGFLYNMVRIIVGTLLDVGRGRKVAADARDIIQRRDRRFAGPTVPPGGLYLFDVYYDKEGW